MDGMRIHQLTPEEAFKELKSRPDGLFEGEAKRRLIEFGPNRVEKVRREPLLLRFLKGFTHFFALILWVAAGLAFIAEWNQPGGGMATLGFAIIGVILINGLFSFWQEYQAEQAITALQRLLPHEAKALREGKIQPIPIHELVPGDLILLEEGDNVPADCRLVEAFGVRVNNATITGESLPKARTTEPSKEEELILSKNMLLAGTTLVSGQAKALIFTTGMQTEFGKIAHLTQTEGEALSPLQKEIIRLSRLIALLSLAIGVIFFFIGRALGLPFWENFIFAIGIIVANVPEGLLPTVTLALALGSKRMAKRNALIRHLPSVETLGSATVICTDKTGTLTQNKMEVKKVFLSGQILGVDFAEGHSYSIAKEHDSFFEVAMLCHNLRVMEKEGQSSQLAGDPMEIALVQMAWKMVKKDKPYTRVDEVPFDADRKRMSTLHRIPLKSPLEKGEQGGLILYTKGALEMVLPLCKEVQMGTSLQPMTPEIREKCLRAQETMAEAGLRILALAYRPVAENYDRDHLEEELVLSGLVGLEDPPRPEVPDAIQKCREAGIKVIMITGDHPHTAKAIAKEIGLIKSDNPVIIPGDQLRRMSNTVLQISLDSPEIIFARVAADQKMRIVGALKKKRQIVAVTGDGVNDAPALKKADIGIAMGIAGTDVAREAADMVLMDDNFASIVAAIEEGRAVYENIRKFLTYILTHCFAELVPYLAFALFKIPLPLTVIQILAIDLGTDTLPALGLGAEKPNPDIMKLPPRSQQEALLNWSLILRAYLFLGPIEAAAAMAAFFYVLHQGGWHYGETFAHNAPLYLQATTATLTAIIVMQVVNVFLCRSDRDTIFARFIFTNGLILWGIVVEIFLILLIDYTPVGNMLFGTAPIAKEIWLFMIPFALGMLILEELRKAVVKKFFFKRSIAAGSGLR